MIEESKPRKNIFESNTYVNSREIMDKLNIGHNEKFRRLADKFALSPNQYYMDTMKGNSRKYSVADATKFVLKVQEHQKSGESFKINVEDIMAALTKHKESVTHKFSKLSRKFEEIDSEAGLNTQIRYTVGEHSIRIETHSELIADHQKQIHELKTQFELERNYQQEIKTELFNILEQQAEVMRDMHQESQNLKKFTGELESGKMVDQKEVENCEHEWVNAWVNEVNKPCTALKICVKCHTTTQGEK